MRKTILAAIAAVTFMLPACDDNNPNWVADPTAKFKVDADAAVISPAPAGVDCSALDAVSSTYKGAKEVRIMALPTPTTVTVRDELLVTVNATVDRRCVAPYVIAD
jgi:hypothetical protein